MSETLSLVDFVVGANSTALNCGVGRAKLMGDSLILDGKFCMEKDFEAIDSMIGPVFCIDAQIDAAVRGQFARLAISVDLKKKPLVSEIKINGRIQRVRYEGLPNICFSCGLYGHSSLLCTRNKSTMEEDVIVSSGSGLRNRVFKLG
ncbi:hypothetical protein Godav_002224 [Gossypium davidsonii]|uniref:Zinc knuckle CX2CX4HX4C domain-containing protein n=1 Tax=Gossypium davidsonii TaxID=34287 RepID=A0A7J8SW89_GOSDV|nr:hypothetical protein [Gossypium davidsonii]